MGTYIRVYVGVTLAIAAFWALLGTNAQARMAKGRLLGDPDPLIAEAGDLWRPGPLWSDFSKTRKRRRKEVLAELQADPQRWRRYDQLHHELAAWNLLESSVALAAPATILALLQPWFD